MTDSTVLDQIANVGILPVIKIDDVDTSIDLATALRAGGINAIEVTVRNETAFQSISKISDVFPDMLVGAGTITNVELAKQAVEAGAKFIVSPGFHEQTVAYCVSVGMPIVPGCVTPSEIQAAQEAGLTTVKFFPAGKYGGVATIKDLSGPFSNMRFVPTGGIGFDDLEDYLCCDAVAAVGGSFMAKSDVIARHEWDTITENCRKCIQYALGFELAHIGINCSDKNDAIAEAEALNHAFPLGVKVGNGKSSFLGSAVELMHIPYYGTNGHIGFKTNSCERAKAYFEKQGLEIIEDSLSYNAKGVLNFFYLKDEIGGFALHVVKK